MTRTGGGEFPCVHCSRHFIDKATLQIHLKTKVHKRRLKELKEKPYSQEEADAAAGLGRETRRSARISGDAAAAAAAGKGDQDMNGDATAASITEEAMAA